MKQACGVLRLSAIVVLAGMADVLLAQLPFSTLQAGFTQSVYGVATPPSGYLFAGLAFAPNGDVWVDDCGFSGGPLYRFQSAGSLTVHGTVIHPLVGGSPVSSGAACGLTNHPDGTIYANTSLGVVNLDASTGAVIGVPFGPSGNALGIAVDPQTKSLVYPASAGCAAGDTTACSIISADPVTKVAKTLVTLSGTQASWVDGVFFDSTGNYIFLSTRMPKFAVTILDRTGTVIQQVSLPSEPDGIAFHVNPTFVVTNNTDGTMTRLDFPANNFAQTPAVTAFAGGGFRGDLAQVGADACLYLSQQGTRYVDGTNSAENSVVKICPGFVPPPGVVAPSVAGGRFVADGAAVKGEDGLRVEYEAALNCDLTKAPHRFSINWRGDHEFKMSAATQAVCSEDSSLAGGVKSKAGFNTITGTAVGFFDDDPGATLQYTLVDAGQPSRVETARLVITSRGTTVLEVSGRLVDGRNEAHKP